MNTAGHPVNLIGTLSPHRQDPQSMSGPQALVSLGWLRYHW
jgi:hypothetical protein